MSQSGWEGVGDSSKVSDRDFSAGTVCKRNFVSNMLYNIKHEFVLYKISHKAIITALIG